jgi:hypothetical protein
LKGCVIKRKIEKIKFEIMAGYLLGFAMMVSLLVVMRRKLGRLIQKWIQPFRLVNSTAIFEHQYLESKAFYLNRFRKVPCITYVDGIDVTKAFSHLQNNFPKLVEDIYQSCFFNRQEGIQQFSKTIFVLKNKVMIELYGQYAEILYSTDKYDFADGLLKTLSEYKVDQKKEAFEINIITSGYQGLELKCLEVKPTKLDIDLYYNDDFKEVDTIIRTRLGQNEDKGIVLLHGLPGTGKTTYLRHLIGGLKKKVLFVSPSVAGNLMNPDFIDLLIDNPNAVLIIEDAENIILDRKYNSSSSVSNLLNLSDGLLSDCLNVQVICTFNNSLSMIDEALMRKGRLIAKYEFGKLNVPKAQRLSNHLGFHTIINKPATLAEIVNPDVKDYTSKEAGTIGFRRELIDA